MSKPALRFGDSIALLILTIASVIGINQYAYGLYNHSITIPFIKSLLNPELYPGDYLIVELKYFYSFFLPVCSFIVAYLKSSLPVTFFILYFISLYTSLLAFFLITLKLFERKDVAYFAMMFLIFSFTTLGMEKTIENTLMERTFALPLLLFSFYAFFNRHFNTAAFLAGGAFLFHPLSAFYVIVMLISCMLYQVFKENRLSTYLTGISILAIVVTPLFILKFQNPAPGLSLIHANPEWINLLRLRSPHHLFPSMWNKLEILQASTLIAGFIVTWKYKPRQQEYHRYVVIFFLVMLVLFVVGTVFTEIIPVSIVIQFQLFRCFKFLVFFTIIYYANYIFTEPNTLSGIARKLFIAALILAPYVQEGKSVLAGILLLIATMVIGLWLSEKRSPKWGTAIIPAQLTMLLLMGIAGSLNRVHFSIDNAQETNWLSVQQWARQNTPKDAAFIAPPYMEGFRVESERTLYVDWKDGTQMFFNPLFGFEWMRRMKMIEYDVTKSLKESYNSLKQNDFERVAQEMRPVHSKIYAVVVTHEGETLTLPEVYTNDKFSVYEVPSVEVAKFNLVEDGSHELVAQSAEVGD